MKMLGKKKPSFKKLAQKVKIASPDRDPDLSHHGLLLEDRTESPKASTPTGFFALYVGEERQRFVVPTGFLSHPLFKMLLEKASDEYGFQHQNGLVIPCSVSTFQEVVNAVECCNRKFEFGKLVGEFI